MNTSVRAKVGDNVFDITPDESDGNLLFFANETSVNNIVGLLECGQEFVISIQNSDAANQQSHFIFTIYGNTNVLKSLSQNGIISSSNSGPYDEHGNYDVTKEDPEILRNRIM